MTTTWLTETFGITVPVVSAPMAGVSGGALAAAVSGAGALGTVGWATGSPDKLRAELDIVESTGLPYGVGLLAWQLPDRESYLDVALASGARLISLCYGDYPRYAGRVHDAGKLLATQVGTLADLEQAVAAGVDVIVARGGEAGGHGRDAVATLPLLQAVLDATDLPVLAAGGIGTARGVAAVLAAGAAGAWVGTAFTAADEATNPEESKDAVVAAGLTDTAYSTVLDVGRGVPWPSEFGGRALRNAYVDTWHGREDELRAAPEPIDGPVVWAGEVAGLVGTRRPAAEIVADLARAQTHLAAAVAGTTRG